MADDFDTVGRSGGVSVSEPKKRIIVDGVEFGQIFLFPKILGCVMSALQPARLAVGLLMVAALFTFGRIWDGLATPPIHPDGLAAGLNTTYDSSELQRTLRNALREFAPNEAPSGDPSTWEPLDADEVRATIEPAYRRLRAEAPTAEAAATLDRAFDARLDDIEAHRPKGAFEATFRHLSACLKLIVGSIVALEPAAILQATENVCIVMPRALWKQAPWFTVVFGLLLILVLAIGGGALSRMAASQVAGGERLRVRSAIEFARGRWSALVWAQVLPMILILLLCGATVAIGVLMVAPVIDIIGGVGYGFALLLGFLIAFLFLGYAVGFGLLVPAVACENCDGADAVQRAYAYAVTKPLHLIVYWIVSIIGLALGFVLVALVARLTLNITAELFGAVSDNPALAITGVAEGYELMPRSLRETGAWHSNWAADAIQFWQTLVVCLVGGWVFAYHFSASTVVYLLMRRLCDGQEIDDIWRPGEAVVVDVPSAEVVDEQ